MGGAISTPSCLLAGPKGLRPSVKPLVVEQVGRYRVQDAVESAGEVSIAIGEGNPFAEVGMNIESRQKAVWVISAPGVSLLEVAGEA